MHVQDTDAGQGRRVWWPLFAAIAGLALPIYFIFAMGELADARWYIPLGATLLLTLLAGLTVPYPRSLWNTPAALQAGEIALAFALYFIHQDTLRERPGAGEALLLISAVRGMAILWTYASNSAFATWLLVIYQGLNIGYLLVAIVVVHWMRGGNSPAMDALFLAMTGLRIAAIYLMLKAHRTILAGWRLHHGS